VESSSRWMSQRGTGNESDATHETCKHSRGSSTFTLREPPALLSSTRSGASRMESIRGSSSAALSAMSSVRSSKGQQQLQDCQDNAFESPSHHGELTAKRENLASLSKQFKNLELGIQRSGWEMRQIDARYRLIKKLKGGAMAVVYLADDITSTVVYIVKHQVVLKVLQASGTFEQRQRMVREVSLVARVKHPNVVHYQDAAEKSDRTMFIAMSVIQGRGLQRVLHVNKQLHPCLHDSGSHRRA
jgi:hypothetical protein